MKRWTVMFMALAMAISGLSIGCGGGDEKKGGGGKPPTKPATTQPK